MNSLRIEIGDDIIILYPDECKLCCVYHDSLNDGEEFFSPSNPQHTQKTKRTIIPINCEDVKQVLIGGRFTRYKIEKGILIVDYKDRVIEFNDVVYSYASQ